MKADKIKILALEPTLSKILDTLCYELSITEPDQNSLTLLEILEWKIKDQLTQQQFHELYKDWLTARNIKNILATRQKAVVQKSQLLNARNINNKQFLTIPNISKCLELLNDQYNKQFLKQSSKQKLGAIQTIFSYLDKLGNIHLRISEIMFMYLSLVYTKNKPFPVRENFKKRLYDFVREIDSINTGVWSLRNFKNYVYLICEYEDLDKIIKFFKWYAPKLGQRDSLLPNFFEQALSNWQSAARFETDNRKIKIYKRIFEEHQIHFFIGDVSMKPNERIAEIYKQFETNYGEKFMETCNIDLEVIKQFYELCQNTLDKHIIEFYQSYKPNLRNASPKTQKKIRSNPRSEIYWNPEYIQKINKSKNIKNSRQNKFDRSLQDTFFSRISKGLNFHDAIKNYINSLTKSKSNTKRENHNHSKSKSKSKSKDSIIIVDDIKEYETMRVTPFQTAMKVLKNL